ncbi:hypothetical protein [Nocardioides cynanchi]|uniref:hypothetical protein n=1 Tax=Nocardioides cynanchi TaxID=2558918 RepID=UPI0012483D2C|nr:hypothetical protein [Nocardioides cynanchi]
MTAPVPSPTYVYVAEADLADRLRREASARLRRPLPVGILLVFGLVLGIVSSLITNAASLPTYRGRVLLIGVVWGLVWAAAVVVLTAVLVVPVSRWLIGRRVARDYPEGSVTEVELGAEALVVTRPTGTRTFPYREITRVRPIGSWLAIVRRGRLVADLLPQGVLPEPAVDLIRARARGVAPTAVDRWDGEPTRQMVVPPGWAAHLAAVHTRTSLTSRRFLVRTAIASLVSLLPALVLAPAWLVAGPVLALLNAGVTYVQTRSSLSTALPSGSVASTEVLADRLVSRNAGGTREIPFDQVRSAEVHGDVVFLMLEGVRGRLLIARDLLPDDLLDRLPR